MVVDHLGIEEGQVGIVVVARSGTAEVDHCEIVVVHFGIEEVDLAQEDQIAVEGQIVDYWDIGAYLVD